MDSSAVLPRARAESFAAVALGAVVSALTSACDHGPVVMVLEDLQRAGESGLRGVRYIVERTAELPVLFLATHRDGPPDASAEVSVLTAELVRLRGVHRLDLSGFDIGEVSSYLTAVHAGDAASIRSGAALLRDATCGNPFLLGEVWRELQRHGGLDHLAAGDMAVPGSLRGLVRERLARLEPGDRDIVTRGAVIGESLGVELVRVSGVDPGRSASSILGPPILDLCRWHAPRLDLLHARLPRWIGPAAKKAQNRPREDDVSRKPRPSPSPNASVFAGSRPAGFCSPGSTVGT